MDQNFRKRLQKTLYSGELEPEHCPLALTELAVEYFQELAPRKLDYVDLQSASTVTSQETVSPSSVAVGMVYAKRLQRKRPDYITKMSSSDLFIISMMMASKYMYDEGVDEEVFNDEWAENAGLETEEVNSMEMDFLDASDWELYIKKEDFEQAMLSIEKNVALREGLKRGWFSYTDLHLLLGDVWRQLLGSDMGLEWFQVMVVSSAAYVASIMTMVGSTILVTNTCVALSSVSVLPLSPTLHLHPALPAPPPVLCPRPALDCPLEMSPPVPALGANETKQEVEEEQPGSPHQPWMPGQSLVDTILSQLMAVLTLKSHLAQFVYAVSDSYVSNRGRNHSARKEPQYNSCCSLGAEEVAESEDQEMATTSSLMLRLLGTEEAPAELDCLKGSCLKCENQESPLGSRLVPALSTCRHGSRWWTSGVAVWRPGSGRTDEQCGKTCPVHCRGAETWSASGCVNQAMATTHSSFPDIAIGFSTSVPPPIFAT